MAAQNGEAVDRAHLARVLEDVGERTLRRYALAYLDLLPGRLERIRQAAVSANTAEALRVLFDLRASSSMLGAGRLAAAASWLEATVRSGLAPEPAQLAALRTEARVVQARLRDLLDGELPGAR